MRVISLEAENLKRIKAIQISPEGNVVAIGGKNEQGKSTVMDAIYIAIRGRAVAPPQPVRDGEERCTIKLDLGELRITRTFTVVEGGTFTDTLKVENAEGLRYPSPQKMLDALLGSVGFDPFAFVGYKPERQAEEILSMVPLSVDLDELQVEDESDYANRRDANRDVAALTAQLAGIPEETVPDQAPDRDALLAKLSDAAATNTAIEREKYRRADVADVIAHERNGWQMKLDRAKALRAEADRLDAEAIADDKALTVREVERDALPPLDEPTDVDAVRAELQAAEATLALIARQDRRKALAADLAAKEAEALGFDTAMKERAKRRNEAFAKAKMPIAGLSLVLDAKGKPVVQLDGVPFSQGSKAQKLRASTAIAMAANPTLRVLRIEDGSLLDDESLQLLTDMADTEGYQLWAEFVGTHNSAGQPIGIIMEDGAIRGAVAPEPAAKPAAKGARKPSAKATDKDTGGLL